MTTSTLSLTLPNAEAKQIVRQLAPAVAGRTALPVLGGVRVTIAPSGEYRFDVTDLELAVSIGSANGGGKSCVLPFKVFKNIISKLPRSGDVTIDTDGKVGPAALTKLPIEDFPQLTIHPDGWAAWHLDAQAFIEAFRSVAVAATKDQARPVLTGIKFELSSSGLTLVATDSYRLHWAPVSIDDSPVGFGDVSFLIPARVAVALAKMVTKKTKTIAITIPTDHSPTQVCFVVEGTRLASRLIEGEFPNWRQLVPGAPSDNVISGSPGAFAEVVARVGQLAVTGSPVNLDCAADDGVVVFVEATDIGFARERIPDVSYSGEPMTVAYNPTYLLGAVAHAGLPLRLQNGLKASVLGSVPPGRGALVMPIRRL